MTIKKVFYAAVISLFYANSISAQSETFIESKKDTMAFVQIIQDPEINTLNELYVKSQDNKQSTKGHMIQIYYGDRDIAYSRKEKFIELYPDIKCEVTYEAPYFKTIVGKYFTKLDADRELEMIRANFKNAFIIQKEIKM